MLLKFYGTDRYCKYKFIEKMNVAQNKGNFLGKGNPQVELFLMNDFKV